MYEQTLVRILQWLWSKLSSTRDYLCGFVNDTQDGSQWRFEGLTRCSRASCFLNWKSIQNPILVPSEYFKPICARVLTSCIPWGTGVYIVQFNFQTLED